MTISHAIERFDLEMYVTNLGGEPGNRGEWLLDCPTCGKEGKLAVNIERKNWHCWVCEEYAVIDGKRVPVAGAGGLLALIELFEGCTRERAAQIVVGQADIGSSVDITSFLEEDADAEAAIAYLDDQQTDVKPAQEIAPPEFWQPIHGNLTYPASRGISVDDVKAFGLFFCMAGRYANRLVFPVWERQKLVYFQARAMWLESDERRGRYIKSLNPVKQEGLATSAEVLMNLDTARHYPRVAVTEGPIDCIHAGPSAVCTFGKKISPIQALKLKYAGVRGIDLMWDGPTSNEPLGAWPEMVKAASQLAGLFDVRLVFLPEGDPGDYDRQDLDYFRSQGRPASTISRLAML